MVKRALQKDKNSYKPLLECVVELITKITEESGDNLIDFSEYLFVLPTREAARLFREKIAETFMEQGGVLSLNTVQPEYFLYTPIENKLPLSQVKNMELWNQALSLVGDDSKEVLFKNNIWRENFDSISWRIGVCKIFQNLRKDVALEKALSCGDFAASIREKLAEGLPFELNNQYLSLAEKLEEYLIFEEKYSELKGVKYCDEADLILHNIHRTTLADNKIKKIILLDTCELKQAVIYALNNLDGVEVELYLNVSEDELSLFDEAGHVKISESSRLAIDIDLKKQVALYDKPIDMANKIFAIIRENINYLPTCIGVLSPEIIPYLEFLTDDFNLKSQGKKIMLYAPQSLKLSNCPWAKLLAEIFNLNSVNIGFEKIAQMIRNGLISNYFSHKIENFDCGEVLRKLDELQSNHLLDSLDMLENFIEKEVKKDSAFEFDKTVLTVITEILNIIRNWQKQISDSLNMILTAWQILSEIGEANDLENLEFYNSELELEELKLLVQELASLDNNKLQLEMFKFFLQEKTLEIKGDNGDTIDLSGFLELSWSCDKNLLIAGMNEENFNCAESTDMFLPENLREIFGFTAQKNRHATDIYRFYALNKAHKLGIMIGRSNNAGDKLKAAKLLFYCEDEELPQLCDLIFSGKLYEDMKPKVNGSENKYFPYQVKFENFDKNKISVTEINNYLRCPFDFYMKNIKFVQELNDRHLELENNQIGTILHKVLEIFCRIGGLAQMSYTEMRNHLYSIFDRLIVQEYLGKYQNSLVDIQLENLREMLKNFALRQIDYMQNKSNYSVAAVEKSFAIPLGEFFPHADEKFKNIFFKGKIDRIDTFYENGRKIIQIFDYKSSSKVVNPFNAHIGFEAKDLKDIPPWQLLEIGENLTDLVIDKWSKATQYTFFNVQLPLYMAIVKRNLIPGIDVGDAELRTAYFNLHINFELTRIENFNYCNLFVAGAEEIFFKAVEKIFFEREFWPPNSGLNAEILKKLKDVKLEDFEVQGEK